MGGSYTDAKCMENEQNVCTQWKDKALEIHSNSLGQSAFGSFQNHCAGEVITVISMQLFLLYTGQDHQAPGGHLTKQLPKSMVFGCRSKNTYNEETQCWHLRIGFVIFLCPHLCKKIKLCSQREGR